MERIDRVAELVGDGKHAHEPHARLAAKDGGRWKGGHCRRPAGEDTTTGEHCLQRDHPRRRGSRVAFIGGSWFVGRRCGHGRAARGRFCGRRAAARRCRCLRGGGGDSPVKCKQRGRVEVVGLRPGQEFGRRVAAATGKALFGGRTAARLVHAGEWPRAILGGEPLGGRRAGPRLRTGDGKRYARDDDHVGGEHEPGDRSRC